MANKTRQSGFSLTEMLLATGIMAIGMMLIALVFPVGVKLTALATERTIAAVVADEAVAKIQLYGMRDFQHWPAARMNPIAGNPNPLAAGWTSGNYIDTNLYAFGPDKVPGTPDDIAVNGEWAEFLYPSAVSTAEERVYGWSALCRRIMDAPGAMQTEIRQGVQVTIFISRKAAGAARYRGWRYDWSGGKYAGSKEEKNPMPVPVLVEPAGSREIRFSGNQKFSIWDNATGFTLDDCRSFFTRGCKIVHDSTGRIFQVSRRSQSDVSILELQEDWPFTGSQIIWVVPPAVGSSRNPCVEVYQKTLYFENIQ